MTILIVAICVFSISVLIFVDYYSHLKNNKISKHLEDKTLERHEEEPKYSFSELQKIEKGKERYKQIKSNSNSSKNYDDSTSESLISFGFDSIDFSSSDSGSSDSGSGSSYD